MRLDDLRLPVPLFLSLALLACANPGNMADGEGCTKDADCKGDRVCDSAIHACVAPGAGAGGRADSASGGAGGAAGTAGAAGGGGAGRGSGTGSAGTGSSGSAGGTAGGTAGGGSAGAAGAGGAGRAGSAGSAGTAGGAAGAAGGAAGAAGGAAGTGGMSAGGSTGTAGTGGAMGAMCVPSAGPCNEVTNQGCAANQKCTIGDVANPTRCACGGGAAPGGACNVTINGDTCASGNICLSDDQCHKYCRTDADCGGLGACIVDILFQTGQRSSLKVCSGAPSGCSPLPPATGGCPAGQGCYWFGGAAGNMCLQAGTLATNAACTSSTDCRPGNLCVSVNGGGSTCLQVCDPGNPACPGGRTCRMLTGGGAYGACI